MLFYWKSFDFSLLLLLTIIGNNHCNVLDSLITSSSSTSTVECHDSPTHANKGRYKELACKCGKVCDTVRWYFSKNCISWSTADENLLVENKKYLFIKSFQKDKHEGYYKCEFDEEEGNETISYIIKLNSKDRFLPDKVAKPTNIQIDNVQQFNKDYKRLVLKCDIEIDEIDRPFINIYMVWMMTHNRNFKGKCLSEEDEINSGVEIPTWNSPPNIEIVDGYQIKAVRHARGQIFLYLTIEEMKDNDFGVYQCAIITNFIAKCSNLIMIEKKERDYSTVLTILFPVLIILGVLTIIITIYWYNLVILIKIIFFRNNKSCLKENCFHIHYEIDNENVDMKKSIDIAIACRTTFQLKNLPTTIYHYDHKCYAINQDKADLLNQCYVAIILVTEHYISSNASQFKSDLAICGLSSTKIWPKRIYILVDLTIDEFYRQLMRNFDLKFYNSIKEDIVSISSCGLFDCCSNENIANWPAAQNGPPQSCNFLAAFRTRRIFTWLESQLPSQALKKKTDSTTMNTNIRFYRNEKIEVNF